MLEELDYSRIPNFEKIDQRFRNLPYDPENRYTVPYTWGTLGLIYNANMVDGELDSWGALYDDAHRCSRRSGSSPGCRWRPQTGR